MANPYALADKAREQINKSALGREKKAKSKLSILAFDELNVLQEMDSLYSDLDGIARKQYRKLWRLRFLEEFEWLISGGFAKKAPDEDTIDELLEMHLAGLLEEPNDATHYIYGAEVTRKRDRAKEAILSVKGKAQKQIMMDKHLRYLLQQAAWYTDFTSQDAEISALKEAGVEKVIRREMKDDKVCAICKAAEGSIYDVDKIPPLDHLGCRRWFEPVK